MHWLSRCGEFSCRKRSYHGREFAKNLVFVGPPRGGGGERGSLPRAPSAKGPQISEYTFCYTYCQTSADCTLSGYLTSDP